jgi:hypothetical protein
MPIILIFKAIKIDKNITFYFKKLTSHKKLLKFYMRLHPEIYIQVKKFELRSSEP